MFWSLWPILLASEEDELLHTLLFGMRRQIEDGRSYLVKERKPGRVLRHTERLVHQGYTPLYITRQHPNHVQRKIGDRDVRVVWLSTTLGRDYVDPHNLNILTNLITSFVQAQEKSVVVLDGLEYLMLNNDYRRILEFLGYVNEAIVTRHAVLLISVDERTFDRRELALLERTANLLE